ncbi:MAG: hypothetical protein AAB874_06710 [Patescibacteria group bacterium]
MKQLVVILLATAVAFATSSCAHQKPKNFIIPVDLSDSRDSATINWYKETIKNSILNRMGPKDRLTVLPVDHNSETWGQEIFRVDFSKNNYGNEYAGLQQEGVAKKNLQDSILTTIQQFEKSFALARANRFGFNNGTDIIGSLKIAHKYFNPEYKNIIVVLSDMMQMTDKGKMNFEEHLNSPDEIDHYLSVADKVDLKNMQIIVLTGALNQMQPQKFGALKSFWEKYFTQCNGEVIDYSSGAITKLKEVLPDK